MGTDFEWFGVDSDFGVGDGSAVEFCAAINDTDRKRSGQNSIRLFGAAEPRGIAVFADRDGAVLEFGAAKTVGGNNPKFDFDWAMHMAGNALCARGWPRLEANLGLDFMMGELKRLMVACHIKIGRVS